MAYGMNTLSLLFLLIMYSDCLGKIVENKTTPTENKFPNKMSGGAGILFADELKQTLEKYLFGICPQNYKMALGSKVKNVTAPTCDIDADQEDLAGRLASLSLRALTAGRGDCSRLGAALANTFGELARTASNRQILDFAQAEANKKRKLSKSQKAKIQAKQRTALAVKKKAAAAAAAAAAKVSA